jgi:hypothetical protein
MTIQTNSLPANTGGIDLSHIDVATAVFNATGGGYGNPSASEPSSDKAPSKTSDWVTNWGNGTFFSDEFDFDQPPPDRDAEIKLLAEPEVVNPLMDIFKGADVTGEGDLVFKNGGPEGVSIAPIVVVGVVAAVVIIGGVAAAAYHLSGAAGNENTKADKPTSQPQKDPKTGLNIYQGGNPYIDPDADTGESLSSPAKMLADMLAGKGITGVDTSSPEVTDILAKLSDRLGKVADVVTHMTGAADKGDGSGDAAKEGGVTTYNSGSTGSDGAVAQTMIGMKQAADAGDHKAFANALADLMEMAGIDVGAFAETLKQPESVMDAVLDAYGIVGGLDGIEFHEMTYDQAYVSVTSEKHYDASHWIVIADDGTI